MELKSFGGLDLEKLEIGSFWVVPDAGSFMFSLKNIKGEEIEFLIVQHIDLEAYFDDQIPGRIYVNDNILPLACTEEQDLMLILKTLIKNQLIGHPEGLAVHIVRDIISFFESDAAKNLDQTLKNQ